MKQLTACLPGFLLFLIPNLLLAQNDPRGKKEALPCCSVVLAEPPDGVGPVDALMIRNNTTGRTYLVKSVQKTNSTYRAGDLVDADLSTNKIRSIKGIPADYRLMEPFANSLTGSTPGTPCCNITSISAIPGAPCCNVVKVTNKTSGQTYSFTIDESYLGNSDRSASVIPQLRVGQPAYMNSQQDYVLIQGQLQGQPVAYSYPLGNAITEGSAMKWEVLNDSAYSGPLGTIYVQMPRDIKFMSHLQVYKNGETRPVASWFGNNSNRLFPGDYDVVVEKYRVSHVPVEKGKITRLKMGILAFSPRQSVQLVDQNKQSFSMAGPFRIALPEGTYYLNGKKDQAIVIRDGEVTEY